MFAQLLSFISDLNIVAIFLVASGTATENRFIDIKPVE
jgi:hypothetical protein